MGYLGYLNQIGLACSLAGLEVAEKFVVVGWGGVVVQHLATMSNFNEVALELLCMR